MIRHGWTVLYTVHKTELLPRFYLPVYASAPNPEDLNWEDPGPEFGL